MRILCYRILGLGYDDILMEQVKGMKSFILVKFLQDDSKGKGMKYIYLYADIGCCEVMSYVLSLRNFEAEAKLQRQHQTALESRT